ncbi:DUF4350 domain-containing protein [Pseudoxanthomonas dokdonensis]|uniref:DUF4350 domain-containing protein n=1 Tax=Pseudoxanthomonas dokdonensis TaxID=344882 RepID=A0A0R0CR84_9GAMM|nr:DUF4350 domain-containing protein [Pseudoxanthomonas dokdonensis]KRG68398.1 hypothetical protein ABB29_13500 [Pseudoxanthomonas dokdonensis]
MSRRRHLSVWIAASLLLIALVAAGVWLSRNYRQVEKTIYLPAIGEAAYNPLYALRQTLLADGVKAVSRQRLDLRNHRLQPGDTVLLYSDPGHLLASESRQLLEWVASGGHLLVRTPPPRRVNDGIDVPLLQAIGIQSLTTEEQPARCVALQVAGEEEHIEFCRGSRFHSQQHTPELQWGDDNIGLVYARLAHGQGRVDVVADFDFLDNGGGRGDGLLGADLSQPPTGGLRDGPHRALARQLLAPNYGRGTMHLVYAARMPSLLHLILSRGWPVWLPLLLALLAWLWMRMQRLGPLLPAPATARRSLLEHVRASGDHLYRYGRGVLLHEAVRQAFLLRLRRRDPVAAALSGEPRVQAIAERLGLPASQIRDALQTPAAHDHHGFRERISTLVQMRNQL